MGTQSDFLVGFVNSVGHVDFETVYQTELPRIYNFFRYRLGNDQLAEDLTAETFEKAWKHRERYREDLASFSTWLFALATNLYRSELRRIPAGTVSMDDVAEPRDPRAGDGSLEAEDRDRSVRRAVSTLPAKYRDALVLFYFHEMDVPAAALSLGLPEGTVKARLFRGRQILRGKLLQLLGEPRWKEGV